MLHSASLPEIQRFVFDDPQEGSVLEFRLIYRGTLHTANAKRRVSEKHRIRKEFHIQMRELWNRDVSLKRFFEANYIRYTTPPNTPMIPGPRVEVVAYALPEDPNKRPYVDMIADNYARCGFRFIPLVRRKNDCTCSLDVLFLRTGPRGDLVVRGDVDNRVKALIDSLRMPVECSEIDGDPADDENPFFCLLEDDSLISSLTVTTDRLLRIPAEERDNSSYAEIVIRVTVVDPTAIFGGNSLA